MDRTLCLCAGTQSSGSTLISWCFLQRADMNGVLDGENDVLPALPLDMGTPLAWYKTTIASFQLRELAVHVAALGWKVRPLLVVRDVRAAWASLSRKRYVRNGTTAEDPPIRIRLLRFLHDWHHFRDAGLPILQYEQLVAAPERTLQNACRALQLPWDDAMVHWPKSLQQIVGHRNGSPTFHALRGTNLIESLRPAKSSAPTGLIAPTDLEWLEETFAEFNDAMGYPDRRPELAAPHRSSCAPPDFRRTRRVRWELRRKPIRSLFWALGWKDPTWMKRIANDHGDRQTA